MPRTAARIHVADEGVPIEWFQSNSNVAAMYFPVGNLYGIAINTEAGSMRREMAIETITRHHEEGHHPGEFFYVPRFGGTPCGYCSHIEAHGWFQRVMRAKYPA